MSKELRNLLVDQKLITAEQAQECLQESLQSGVAFEQCLFNKQYLTPVAFAQALAQSMGLEYVEKVTDKMADPDILSKIPLHFLRDNAVIPLVIDGQLTILTANPLHVEPVDNLLMLLGGEARSAVAPRSIIIDAINRYYPIEGAKQMIEELAEEDEKAVDFGDIDETDILGMASDAPIIKLVNHILYQAVKRGASDIHIEPFEKELSVRYRIDGVMHAVMMPPKRLQGALASRIKIMGHGNIAEKRLPQDLRIQIKVADKPIDIRVSLLPVAFGERIVMRLLDKSRTFADLNQLGMSPRDVKVVLRNIERPNGIIFVTGPTGSGKTTTLYSILSRLNTPDVNIVTVEDPVEYQMNGIGQVHVREKIGLTFAAALRSILRQDPDIVMIGEIRDQETAQIAIQAALTGHLVLSTLHTNNAPSTITRLLDMGIEPFLIASSIVCAIAQRLVRKLCDKCKKTYKPLPETLERFGITAQQAASLTFYEAVGCEECLNTGYRGRLPIFEVMEVSDALSALIMERADTSRLRKQAAHDGMTFLMQDGLRQVQAGATTLEEVLAVATLEQDTGL